MAISFVGESTGTTTATIPTHQAGDLMIIWAFRSGSNSTPTVPTGWTSIKTNVTNSAGAVAAWKIAVSSTDTSGTWTNATGLVCMVYRGTNQTAPIGGSATNTAASTTVNYPALTMTVTNGSSWVVGVAAHRSTNTTIETPPTGMTNRADLVGGSDEVVGHDTNGGVSSWSSTNVSVGGTSSGWASVTFELVALVLTSFSTFTDPMTGNIQNTSIWGGNFGTLSWSPSGFTITNPIAYTGYGGQDTLLGYDLTGQACWCDMPIAGNQLLTSCETVPFKLVSTFLATNALFFYINGGTLTAFKNVAGGGNVSVASATYNPLTHVWFNIAEGTAKKSSGAGSSGTIYFETSADGSTWTLFASLTTPFNITSLKVEPSLGTFSSELLATSASWVSFNTTAGTVITKTQTATSRIAINFSKTQSSVSRIVNNLMSMQMGTSRIQKGVSKTQSAVARISQSFTKTQNAVGRIQRNLDKTQPATGRISKSSTRTQGGISRISTNLSKTQSALATIIQSGISNKTQTAVARIASPVSKLQSAIARIQVTLSKTQPATGRVAINFSKTQTAVSRISISKTKTQTSIARIQLSLSKTQTAVASITGGAVSTQISQLSMLGVG